MGELAGGGGLRVLCLACSVLQSVLGSRELTLQASVSTPPPAPFSFEAGGREGGGSRSREWRLLSRPRNVLSSRGGCQLWPGPQAPRRHFLCPWLPPPLPPCRVQHPWADRGGILNTRRMNMDQVRGQGGLLGEVDGKGAEHRLALVALSWHWQQSCQAPTLSLHLLQRSSPDASLSLHLCCKARSGLLHSVTHTGHTHM